jgi:hypothetical protein
MAGIMNDRIRISDADREQAAARLRDHFAEGRLSPEELDERITAVFSAKTHGDLRHVLADLPGEAPVAPLSAQAPPWDGPRWVVYRRRPRLLPVLLLALVAALVIPGAGWLFLAFFQFLLVAALIMAVAGVVAAARFRRHVRRRWGPGGPAVYWRHHPEHGQPGW